MLPRLRRLALSAALWAAFLSAALAGTACHGIAGTASWYGAESGSRTSTGERFNGTSMTAATLRFPLGSILRVTDLSTGRANTVRDNDHGPYVRGRNIDLSKAAARALGMNGLAHVCVERLK